MIQSALKDYIEDKKSAIEEGLRKLWKGFDGFPPSLYSSMEYSLFAGGKRIRPILVIAAAEAVGSNMEKVMPVALAIEMIHTYSLIHDDLPAMDNDDLRRGKPTNHKVFGEATAILAGDGLLTMAFTILSDRKLWDNDISSEKILRIIHEIGIAAGPAGMVGGQQIDIESEGKELELTALEGLHRRKTGALIKVSVMAGGIAGKASEQELMSLTEYGEKIGLAFQICDDIIDVVGDIEETGKLTGKDKVQHKNTYPGLMGMEKSKILKQELLSSAIAAIDGFDEKADPLRWIASFIVTRKR